MNPVVVPKCSECIESEPSEMLVLDMASGVRWIETSDPAVVTAEGSAVFRGPGEVHGTGWHYFRFISAVEQLKREKRYAEATALLGAMIDAVEQEARVEQDGVGPWYYEQLAIVYRRQKLLDSEVALLERYVSVAAGTGIEYSGGSLPRRLERARALAAKLQHR